jgi:L-serine/L-threonine ammonia-lyase
MASQLHIETPLIYSAEFSKQYNRDVYLKLELLQPSGSFKLRGIGHLIQIAIKNGHTEFICSSGGNAGLAAAYTCQVLNVPCTVCIPQTTPTFIRNKLAAFGANVVVHGDIWAEADFKAKELMIVAASKNGKMPFYVPPFNHADIWTGNSTMIDEIVAQLPKAIQTNPNKRSELTNPAAIAVAVGGGGLLNGVCEGLVKHNLTDVQILTCETLGSSCLATAIKHNEPTKVKIDSLATSLGASVVSQRSFDYSKELNFQPILVSDPEAIIGISKLLNSHNLLVEPACGCVFAGMTALFDEEYREYIHSGHYDETHLDDDNCKYLTCTVGLDSTPASQKTQPIHTQDHLTYRFFDRLIPQLKDVKDWARIVPQSLQKSDCGPIIIIVCGGSITSPQILRYQQILTQTKHFCERFDVGYSYIEDYESRQSDDNARRNAEKDAVSGKTIVTEEEVYDRNDE